MTTVSLSQAAVNGKCPATDFLAFYLYELNTAPLRPSTKANHFSTYRLLADYQQELPFPALTFEFVTSFARFLVGRGYHLNTVAKHMRHLKRYVNTAIDHDLMGHNQYPFKRYKIKTVERHHVYLFPEELNRLETTPLQGRHARLQHAKDAFLFCCYTGLRYSDFVSLTAANVVKQGNSVWLIYRSVKTQTLVKLPLNLLFGGKPLHILKKYQTCSVPFFRLPDNSNLNKKLRLLSRLSGIDKRFSFHAARHTNATLLIYNGVSLSTVQKLLGHKSIRTTQLYADVMDATLIKDLRNTVWQPSEDAEGF